MRRKIPENYVINNRMKIICAINNKHVWNQTCDLYVKMTLYKKLNFADFQYTGGH